ncbi:MAG: sugar phosphate isomerase/epimerase family protein [Rhodomicrobiaceae bacterium]
MNIADELSIQLYTLRHYGSLETQLEALAGIGFRRVEITGAHLEDAKETRTKLDEFGISAPTGHVNMAMLRERLDWVAGQAHVIGIEELYMPALPDAERFMPADCWRQVGEELGQMASKMKSHGVALGYHNHDWELTLFADGTTPLAHLFAGAEGSPLTFEADLAWIVRGGADALETIRPLQDRLTALHVKDLAPEGTNAEEDGWADIGAGTLDWPHLWSEGRAMGARWMVLEHDNPKNPIAFAEASRNYLLQKLS